MEHEPLLVIAPASLIAGMIASEVCELVRTGAGAGGAAVLGLATGRTMSPVHDAIVAAARGDGLDWSRVQTFGLDDRLGLAPGDPARFASVLRRELLDPLGVLPTSSHFPDADAADLELACARYESEIESAGGIDLQLLGIGRNGHVAFNEPGAGRESRTRVVELEVSTIADLTGGGQASGAPPLRAITMGVATILGARRLRLIAVGESKAAAVADMLAGTASSDCPASLLVGHADLVVLVDAAAARLLPRR